MPTHVLESELAAEQREAPSAPLPEHAERKPYAPPVVASYELDPHDVGSADALTANG